MPNEFPYDVFLSHSAKDKAAVRPLAERLRQDGLKVPFHFGFRTSDFGSAQPGMSANTFGSDWAQLEAGTFRFRDPLNQERRFIPLRLDDAPIKGSLAQFLHINWRPSPRKQQYPNSFDGSQPGQNGCGPEPIETRQRALMRLNAICA
jgi:hypothetical protein